MSGNEETPSSNAPRTPWLGQDLEYDVRTPENRAVLAHLETARKFKNWNKVNALTPDTETAEEVRALVDAYIHLCTVCKSNDRYSILGPFQVSPHTQRNLLKLAEMKSGIPAMTGTQKVAEKIKSEPVQTTHAPLIDRTFINGRLAELIATVEEGATQQ